MPITLICPPAKKEGNRMGLPNKPQPKFYCLLYFQYKQSRKTYLFTHSLPWFTIYGSSWNIPFILGVNCFNFDIHKPLQIPNLSPLYSQTKRGVYSLFKVVLRR